MTWNEEAGVCHNCNNKLLELKRSFHEDKLKYLREHLIRKNNWNIAKAASYEDYVNYEDYVKHHSLASSDIKQINFIFEELLTFLSILGYTKVTLNYLYPFKLMYKFLGIKKQLDMPTISNENKWFHDEKWSNFLPYLNHVLEDKHKREDERRNIINVISLDTSSEIIRQQEWESCYCFD